MSQKGPPGKPQQEPPDTTPAQPAPSARDALHDFVDQYDRYNEQVANELLGEVFNLRSHVETQHAVTLAGLDTLAYKIQAGYLDRRETEESTDEKPPPPDPQPQVAESTDEVAQAQAEAAQAEAEAKAALAKAEAARQRANEGGRIDPETELRF